MLNSTKKQKMKSRFLSGKTLSIIILSMVLLTACKKESDDLAAPVSLNEGAHKSLAARPFVANFNATVDANSPNPPTACSGDVPGFGTPDFLLKGTATHIGQINAQLSSLHHVSCDLSVATMLLTTNVFVELATINGDLLYCTGNDAVDVANLLTGAGTTGAITGTWTITGGTGRFNGASGSFTISGLVDFVANTFSCECVGTISY